TPASRVVVGGGRSPGGPGGEGGFVGGGGAGGGGGWGQPARGHEKTTNPPPADLLVATLGKAFGVNGGYVVAEEVIIRYLRETSPLYIYSNPITPAEAAAAHKAVDILDSPAGAAMLMHLRSMTARFKAGPIRRTL